VPESWCSVTKGKKPTRDRNLDVSEEVITENAEAGCDKKHLQTNIIRKEYDAFP